MVISAAADRTESEIITVTEGSTKRDANAAMVPITTVIGQVTDAQTGLPLPNVCAYLYPVDTNVRRGVLHR